jgi:hypothetical protein
MEIYRELYQISKDLREFTIKAKRLHMLIKNNWQERILDPEVFRGRDAEGNYILYKQEIPLLIDQIQSLLDQQKQELQQLFSEYKEKYPDANWTDAVGLLAGYQIKN